VQSPEPRFACPTRAIGEPEPPDEALDRDAGPLALTARRRRAEHLQELHLDPQDDERMIDDVQELWR